MSMMREDGDSAGVVQELVDDMYQHENNEKIRAIFSFFEDAGNVEKLLNYMESERLQKDAETFLHDKT